MNKFIAILLPLLFTLSAQAAIVGAPFSPENDARFDNVEGNSVVNAKNGLHQKQIAVATYDFAVQGGSSTLNSGVYDLGVSLPSNAIITRSYLYVDKQLVGSGNTIAFKCQTAGNILAATDETSHLPGEFLEGISTGASTLFKAITAPCSISATLGVANLTAGKITSFVEYVMHPSL